MKVCHKNHHQNRHYYYHYSDRTRSVTNSSKHTLLFVIVLLLESALFVSCENASPNNGQPSTVSPGQKVIAILRITQQQAGSLDGHQTEQNERELLTSEIVSSRRSGGGGSAAESSAAALGAEKITGKLIYAKTYDQALLDKLLNKSDTYYKDKSSKCACVSLSASLVESVPKQQLDKSSQTIAFLQQSAQCFSVFTVNDYVQCARDLKASALLVDSSAFSSSSPSSMLIGKFFILVILQFS